MKNDPKKKVSKCVWGYFGGVFMMFPDGFDAFWALQTPIWVLDHPVLGQRCLVACKGGFGGLSRFGGIGGEKSPEKRRVHSGPKDASSAYLFFIRVRVTELVSL